MSWAKGIGFLEPRSRDTAAKSSDSAPIVRVDGEDIPIRLRRIANARRMVLSLDPLSGDVCLTLPKRTSAATGLSFAREREAWIRNARKRLGAPMTLTPDSEIFYRGARHQIVHLPQNPRGVEVQDDEIRIGGPASHLPQRLTRWLKQTARERMSLLAHEKAARIGHEVTGISIRDTRSRWGSCTSDGRLNFSWRLILAPDHVLDYLVAHEVAHLVHRNHSKAFHNQVAELTEHAEAGARWLKENGSSLFRVRLP